MSAIYRARTELESETETKVYWFRYTADSFKEAIDKAWDRAIKKAADDFRTRIVSLLIKRPKHNAKTKRKH